MSVILSGLRRPVAAIALLLALGAVSACADIHPDNSLHSPVFKG